MITRSKTAGKTASLAVSLGLLVAIVASSVTFAAGNPERAFGEIIPPSVDAPQAVVAATTTSTVDSTGTMTATATAEATGTLEATAALAAMPLAPALAPAPKRTVIVPSVLGKSKRLAVKRLKARKLRVKIVRVYSNRKVGVVVGQTPVHKRRFVGSTVRIKVAKRWPSGFKSKAASDRFWRPYVTSTYRQIDRSRNYRGRHRVATASNINMTLRAIWGESRGGAKAGLTHNDGYLGLLQMDRGYGSAAQRLDPIYSIKRMGRGIKVRGSRVGAFALVHHLVPRPLKDCSGRPGRLRPGLLGSGNVRYALA